MMLHPFAHGDAVSLASVVLTITPEQLFADMVEA